MADDTMRNTFRGYMDANGLSEWSLGVGDGPTDTWSAEDKSITVAKHTDVVAAMHTLAHALVGSDEHTSRWRAVAVSLGVDPDSEHPVDEPEAEAEDDNETEAELEADAQDEDGEPEDTDEPEDPSEGKGIVPPYVEEKVAESKSAKKDNLNEYPIVGHCAEGCTLERKRMPSKQVYCKPHGLEVTFSRT